MLRYFYFTVVQKCVDFECSVNGRLIMFKIPLCHCFYFLSVIEKRIIAARVQCSTWLTLRRDVLFKKKRV